MSRRRNDPQHRQHRSGRPWRRARLATFAAYGCAACEQQLAGRPDSGSHVHVCAICGHLGAGDVDHIVSLALDPGQELDVAGLRPAHGTASRCPACPPGRNGRSRACNQERGAGTGRDALPPPLITSREW